MTSDFAALVGAGIGVVGSALSVYGISAKRDLAHEAAVRAQIVSLMRIVEQQMLFPAKYNALPLDGWFSLDRLIERIYSTDGASALHDKRHQSIFSTIAQIQQIRAAIIYTDRKLESPKNGSGTIFADLRLEIRQAGQRGVELLRSSRASLGDHDEVLDIFKEKNV